MLLRIVYFLLVGWWAALLWGLLGYLCCASWVLLPLGTTMLNALPRVLTLKPTERDPYSHRAREEMPFLVRAIWFFAIGWWLGFLAFKVGYVLCLTVIFMPLGVWILHRVPLALTLKQSI